MSEKIHLGADQLLRDAFELGLRIAEDGYRPELLLGIWRGGTPVAIAVQEVLACAGIDCDHIAIRTRSYTGIDTRGPVRVDGLEYLRTIPAPRRILLVDDIFDTGLSMQQALLELRNLYGADQPEIRIAVPWYKPSHNRTDLIPDYYLHSTAYWVVFPHELAGLETAEIARKPTTVDLLRLRALAAGNKPHPR